MHTVSQLMLILRYIYWFYCLGTMSFQKNTKKRGRKPEKDGYSTPSDIERKKYHHKVVKEFRGDDPSTILLTTSTSSPYTLKKKSWLATHHWSYCNDSNNIEESKKVHYESKMKKWKTNINCTSFKKSWQFKYRRFWSRNDHPWWRGRYSYGGNSI